MGRERGVTVQRTLALVARGVRTGVLSVEEAEELVDDLLRCGTRFPLGKGDFIAWARERGLLDPA